MKITIVVDNHSGQDLAVEHGLAFWIQAGGVNILFDTGQGTALPANIEALGIDLGMADHVVLSHGHYDHAGALPYVLERATAAVVHLHPSALEARFSIHEGKARPNGMQAASLAAVKALPKERIALVTEPVELAPGIGLTGPVPRLTGFENPGGPFFRDPEGHEPDPIADDLSLWIDTPRGLVVCLGCAHAGVVNILTHIRQVTRCQKIDTIVGGMHLVAASEARLNETVAALREIAPRQIVPCHCTGNEATAYLKAELAEMLRPGYSGFSLLDPP